MRSHPRGFISSIMRRPRFDHASATTASACGSSKRAVRDPRTPRAEISGGACCSQTRARHDPIAVHRTRPPWRATMTSQLASEKYGAAGCLDAGCTRWAGELRLLASRAGRGSRCGQRQTDRGSRVRRGRGREPEIDRGSRPERPRAISGGLEPLRERPVARAHHGERPSDEAPRNCVQHETGAALAQETERPNGRGRVTRRSRQASEEARASYGSTRGRLRGHLATARLGDSKERAARQRSVASAIGNRSDWKQPTSDGAGLAELGLGNQGRRNRADPKRLQIRIGPTPTIAMDQHGTLMVRD